MGEVPRKGAINIQTERANKFSQKRRDPNRSSMPGWPAIKSGGASSKGKYAEKPKIKG